MYPTYPTVAVPLGSKAVLEAEASSPNGRIRQVDSLGHYQELNHRGNGVYASWHYLFVAQHSSDDLADMLWY